MTGPKQGGIRPEMPKVENADQVPDYEDDAEEGDYDYEEMDPLEEKLGECQLMNDGQCLLAGSEWCDFECPMRDSEHFAGSAAWNKKRKRK